MNMFKKTVSLFLALTLLLSIFVIPATAQESPYDDTYYYGAFYYRAFCVIRRTIKRPFRKLQSHARHGYLIIPQNFKKHMIKIVPDLWNKCEDSFKRDSNCGGCV